MLRSVRTLLTAATFTTLLGPGALVACSGDDTNFGVGQSSGSTNTPDATVGTDAGACTPCVTAADCSGGATCAQVGGDSYCAAPCPNGDECGGGAACTSVVTVAGESVSACLPSAGPCGTSALPDASSLCGPLVPPNTTTTSCVCTHHDGGIRDAAGVDAAAFTCQPNGCRNGEFCNTDTESCQQAPTACGGSVAGVPYDGGAPVTGSVGADGGVVSRLFFAVVGDTRPANIDDTANYPVAIIDRIFSDVAALTPAPSFVVSTGDYQFSTPTGTQATAQLDLYLAARGKYTGVQFPTMGNHECTGATASNCGTGSTDGITNNYMAFVSKLLAPIGQTSPYYAISFAAPDGSWTAKLVFIAGNAWNQTQANWFDATLAQPTTYTFIVRHEPASSDTAPGVGPSGVIMTQHPYTLALVGHTHTYGQTGPKEILVGNGGAPLSGGGDYGFALVNQQSDGTIAVDMIDYTTGLADPTFHLVVNPDGTAAH